MNITNNNHKILSGLALSFGIHFSFFVSATHARGNDCIQGDLTQLNRLVHLVSGPFNSQRNCDDQLTLSASKADQSYLNSKQSDLAFRNITQDFLKTDSKLAGQNFSVEGAASLDEQRKKRIPDYSTVPGYQTIRDN